MTLKYRMDDITEAELVEPAALRHPNFVEARTWTHHYHILRRNYVWEALS